MFALCCSQRIKGEHKVRPYDSPAVRNYRGRTQGSPLRTCLRRGRTQGSPHGFTPDRKSPLRGLPSSYDPAMALDAMIFDLDGTLVDTNQAHIEAWRRAFGRHGFNVAADRIALEVGKGGDMLVPAILGKSTDQKDGEALRKAQPEEFAKIAKAEGLSPFAGAVDLVKTVRSRGLKAALATSSNEKQLKLTEECSGVRCASFLTRSSARMRLKAASRRRMRSRQP